MTRREEFRPIVLPEAEDEIREAILWYEERRKGLGMEFFGELESAMARVVATPLACQVWTDDTRYRRMVLRRFPYLLFYEVRKDVIEFVAVAHSHRRPGYWLSRTTKRNEP